VKRRLLRRRYLAQLCRDLAWADVVFVQRLVKGARTLNLVAQCAKPMIYDFDDALFERPQDASGRRIGHKGRIEGGEGRRGAGEGRRGAGEGNPEAEREWSEQVEWLRRMVGQARLCSVSAPALARWVKENFPGKPVLEILGPVDTDRFTPPPDGKRRRVIGWVGGASTSPYLEIIADPLKEALRRHPDWELWLVGAKPAVVANLGIPARALSWSLEEEADLLRQFAVGVQPLPDGPWTRGKGGYKALQYMAVAAPVVSSPVGVNQSLVEHGRTGYLAASPEQWVESLEKLVQDPDLRRRFGQAGREKVVSRHSLTRAADVLSRRIRDLAEVGGVDATGEAE
jgi:glycosyltransferase involved in cell wall biosynthesis